MEILATNISYAAAIFITIIFGIISLVGIAGTFEKGESTVSRVLAGVIALLGIGMLIFVWSDPQYVTYDAIVTDWNEVYLQGYEVVEQNGKIVTLRKVGD